MYEEYNDNNIHHVENGPDYGNSNGKLKWSENRHSIYYLLPIISDKYKMYNILNISIRTI